MDVKMNKILLVILITLSTGSVFAKIPNMKEFPNSLSITEANERTYIHRTDNYIKFYITKDKDATYYEGFDKITQTTFRVYGLLNDGLSPCCCLFRRGSEEVHISEYYQEKLMNGNKAFLFNFYSEDKKLNRLFLGFVGDMVLGFFQTFE
jgi:hypothetical protein